MSLSNRLIWFQRSSVDEISEKASCWDPEPITDSRGIDVSSKG
jgi:hypothetical protein